MANFTGTNVSEAIAPVFASATLTRLPFTFPSNAADIVYGYGGNDLITTVGGAGRRTKGLLMPAFMKSLFGQVMCALVLGVVTGAVWPDLAAQMKPLGDGLIRLIKMIIAPLVFGVVVHGIASAGDLK